MREDRAKNRKRSVGTSTVELAIVTPLLFLMMAGAADFARLFYHAITVDNASEAGSLYGAQNGVVSAQYDGIAQVAKDDAADLEGVSVSPGRYCDCPDKNEINCLTATDARAFTAGPASMGCHGPMSRSPWNRRLSRSCRGRAFRIPWLLLRKRICGFGK